MAEDTEAGLASSILDWSEEDVHGYFSSLGYPYYEQQIHEHGLNGEILVHVGHDALKDIGVQSVGQRLAILKGIYGLRLRDDVPIEEGQWIPPSDDMDQALSEGASGSIVPAQMLEMLGQRDNKIKLLEYEIKRLSASLEGYRDELSAIARAFYSSKEGSNGLARPGANQGRSPTGHAFAGVHPGATPNGHAHSYSLGAVRTSPFLPYGLSRADSSEALPTINSAEMPKGPLESPLMSPQSAGSSNEATERLRPTVLTLHSASPSESIALLSQPSMTSLSQSGPLSAVPQSVSGTSPSTPTPGTPTSAAYSASAMQESAGSRPSTANDSMTTLRSSDIEALRPSIASSMTLVDEDVQMLSMDTMKASHRAAVGMLDKVIGPFSQNSPRHAKSAGAGNPLSSFKVTLEDPCSKVLPAALRKYKINDDWRQYALFLCYGNNIERCLALDERPLILFQRLKENDMNPVFMLRHMKDVRSPLTLAASKHASRRERRQREAEEKTITANSTIAEAVALSNGELSPAKPTRESEMGSLATPVSGNASFGIAVYPYFAERSDEFHVHLRDVFEVDAKAKGWWRVRRHRSRSAPTDLRSSPDPSEGWVPSGCLVEVSHLPPATAQAEDPKSIVHAPGSLISQYVSGPALLDYRPQGDGELRLTKGESLAVYKRYSSWSYAVRNTPKGCEGGWTPSWLVGRNARSGSTS